MACCSKRKPAKANGKTCPRCGWAMYRVSQYDTKTRSVNKYWKCTNRRAFRNGVCNFREKIE